MQLLHIFKSVIDASFGYENLEITPLTWLQWERFVAQFWCLKSSFVNAPISWQSLHAGAMFKYNANEMVQAKKLTLVQAIGHCSTKSKDLDISAEMRTEVETVKPGDGNHHILCAKGNPAGDSFCFLSLSSSDVVTFAISCKNERKVHKAKEYLVEHTKAACNEDFFMEYSTGKFTIGPRDLPNCRCGLVCKENFQDYFGPVSGRAFIICSLISPNMNTAPWNHIISVPGLGQALASTIMNLRSKNMKFQSAADAMGKVAGLGKVKAELFTY